jgi:hypothetical protein
MGGRERPDSIELIGNRPSMYVNGIKLLPNGSVRFSERHLFLGYLSVAGKSVEISANISDLHIEDR